MAMPTTLTVHCENILNKIRKVSGDKSKRSTKVEKVTSLQMLTYILYDLIV